MRVLIACSHIGYGEPLTVCRSTTYLQINQAPQQTCPDPPHCNRHNLPLRYRHTPRILHHLLLPTSQHWSPLRSIIPAGLLGLVIGLALTVPIDSFFWQRFWIWPELIGFIYNVVNKQSVNWGIQPWHFYFTDALPRVLFNRLIILVCLPFTLSIPILRRPALDILIPNLLFIAIYSFQPHKEWRFIVYTIPPINAVALQAQADMDLSR